MTQLPSTGKQQLELDMEQQTGSKSGKEDVKAIYCHPAYLTYMQSTLWEMLNWLKHKLESRFLGEIAINSKSRWCHTYGRKWRRTKELLDESERGEWKSWLKAQHSENEDHDIWFHQFSSVQSLSHVRLLAIPWTAAHQAPPSMGFSRQEYWSGVQWFWSPRKLGLSLFPLFLHLFAMKWWDHHDLSFLNVEL